MIERGPSRIAVYVMAVVTATASAAAIDGQKSGIAGTNSTSTSVTRTIVAATIATADRAGRGSRVFTNSRVPPARAAVPPNAGLVTRDLA